MNDPKPLDTAVPLGIAFDAGVLSIAGLGVLVAPFRDLAQLTTLFANVALIVALVGLRHLVNRVLPSRPVHAASLLMSFAAVQPVALVLACVVEGNVTYRTATGVFSHLDHALRVAAATFVMFASAAAAAMAVGRLDRKPRPSFGELVAKLTDRDLNVLQFLGAALLIAQLGLLFGAGVETVAINRTFGFAYGVQVAIGALWATALFVGVALRRGLFTTRWLLVAMAVAGAIMVVGGNRASPIFAFLLVGVGYVLAAPIKPGRLLLLGSVIGSMVLVSLVVGDVLRSDGAGRSGEVALQRMTQLLEGARPDVDSDTVRITTLHRVLRNSSHTTISRVPETMPFERDGVAAIPDEFIDTFTPGPLREASWRPTLRAEFLRELGYIIEDTTAVEFACLGDAWYRGGWLGLFVVGVIFGVAIQLAEIFVYRGTAREQAMKLTTLIAAVFQMEGRDIAFGVRRLVLMMFTTALVLWVLRIAALRAESAAERALVR
jgi:hypothetical protein